MSTKDNSTSTEFDLTDDGLFDAIYRIKVISELLTTTKEREDWISSDTAHHAAFIISKSIDEIHGKCRAMMSDIRSLKGFPKL